MASVLTGVDRIVTIWQEHIAVARGLHQLAPAVADVVTLIEAALRTDHRLLIAGNGGSAADAQHIAAELTGRFMRDRRPFPALALHANISAVTAIGNDYGYEHVFAREVAAHGRRGRRVPGDFPARTSFTRSKWRTTRVC